MKQKIYDQDTIVAVSTAPGAGGIGIVRLSGSRAIAIADEIFESKTKKCVRDQKSYTVQYGRVLAKKNGEGIDEALLCLMRTPKSYTREDVVEISVHGGGAVLQAVLASAVAAGARLAEPGEFTKRAFLNGRIDLLQAEAVLDLIQAKTEHGRRWASAQLEGSLSQTIQTIKTRLIQILSHLDAAVDFPDDFPEVQSVEEITGMLEQIREEIQTLLAGSALGLLAKSGFRVAIFGKPNVGKSSLMNGLIKSNRVIVTPYPGTTRDVVEEEIQIGGFPVRLFDTAGIHDTEHPIEKEGMDRSRKTAIGSDLLLFVLDGSMSLTEADKKLLKEVELLPKTLVVNKMDLPAKLNREELRLLANHGTPIIESSCVTEEGLKTVEDQILQAILGGKEPISGEAIISSVRQKSLLEKMLHCVENAAQSGSHRLSPELIAVDIREALEHVGALAGEVVTDDVLDVLFGQFCIGK